VPFSFERSVSAKEEVYLENPHEHFYSVRAISSMR
jgi:hypothetical protein